MAIFNSYVDITRPGIFSFARPNGASAEVLQLQQVAKSSDGAVANSVWLYYVAPGVEFRGIEGQIFFGEPSEPLEDHLPGLENIQKTRENGQFVDLPIKE